MATKRPLGSLAALLVCACAGGLTPVNETTAPPAAPGEREARPETTVDPRPGRPRVAVAVTLSDPTVGSFAERVLEGVRLAVEERGVDLDMLVEEGGGAAGVARAEAAGALVVIGPLDDRELLAAADARTDLNLALVSPVASRVPVGSRNVYAVNGEDSRGAEALAAWAAQRGMRTVGLLYASVPGFMSQAEAFRLAAAAAGLRIVEQPYAPGTTTFADPLRALASAGVEAAFIPAAERDVRQIAPQVRYYGLGNVRILGNEAWVSSTVLREVDPAALEGVVAATPVSPDDEAAWDAFARRYEDRYRRSLDSPAAALGHDAALLVLEALAGGGTRADVARRLQGVSDLRGATGVLSVRNGILTRRPYLVEVREGRVYPVTR